jgi:hypothetical protein
MLLFPFMDERCIYLYLINDNSTEPILIAFYWIRSKVIRKHLNLERDRRDSRFEIREQPDSVNIEVFLGFVV